MEKTTTQCIWCSTFIKEWYETEGELMNNSCLFGNECDFPPIMEWKSKIGCAEEKH